MDAYKLESFALASGDDGSFLGAGTEDNEEGEQTNLDFGGRARYAVQRGTKRNKYRNRTMVDFAPLPSADDNNAIPTALLSAAVLCSYICLCCIYMFLLRSCCSAVRVLVALCVSCKY